MRLKKIINKLKNKIQKQTSFSDYAAGIGNNSEIVQAISKYIDCFLLSKNEAILWMRTFSDELDSLRSRIDELECEKHDILSNMNSEIGGHSGLTRWEIDAIEESISLEYQLEDNL